MAHHSQRQMKSYQEKLKAKKTPQPSNKPTKKKNPSFANYAE